MFEDLKQAIITGDAIKARQQTELFLKEGLKPGEILNAGILPGMDVVGQRFKAYEMYLPEVLMSADAMKKVMELLKPLLSKSEIKSQGKIVIATVEGDLHDIGKNLVAMMLEGAGFEVVDLGVDIPIPKIIEEAKKNDVDIIAASALLTTTMLALELVVKEARKNYKKAKVIVGGAPITNDFANKIGADGFAPDALRAVDLVKRLLG